MPVVSTVNIVDRLRDIKKRIDIRPSLQNAHRRCQSAYETVSVGSPHLVQEFYKHVKVYKQCPQNDLLFMNMTVQLARAAVFPTKSMFKQMEKFEKHMEDVMKAEGADWVTAGLDAAKGIEILSGRNKNFMDKYAKYKCRVVEKKREKERKTAKKNAKILAAVKDARAKNQNAEVVNRQAESLKPFPMPNMEVPRGTAPSHPNFKSANEALAAKIEEAKKKKIEADEVANQLIEVVEKLIAKTTATEDQKPEDEEAEKVLKNEEKLDDEDDDGEEEEEEDDDDEEEGEEEKGSSLSDDTSDEENDPEGEKKKTGMIIQKDEVCNFVQLKAGELIFHAEEDSDFEKPELSEPDDSDFEEEEESIEKIEEKDVDALEYEML